MARPAAGKIDIGTDYQEINPHCDRIPHNDRPRFDQDAVIDPHDLKGAHNRSHRRIHAYTGTPLEHGDEIGHGSKCGAEARHEADKFMQGH